MDEQDISRELLFGYADDSLSTEDTTRVEHALRNSAKAREQYREVIQEIDRGDHSMGAIWRREHITCPTREQLGAYLLEALDPKLLDYIEFHLNSIGCPYCQANLVDLESQQENIEPAVQLRRQRYFQSSAGLLKDSSLESETL
ncbi:MAG: hypothetical protein ACFCD0_21950 [Gemmataceae bacterium]